ncbi:homoserine dehydrogenase [Desulfosudis oleivorans]|uniref:Homoserine dehydrogenase, NAD binding domain n=1 Tax=Desulfosudis oleivorans (strain DSM 6200 / JCM 39069 / Hxd3) TaxID=96561 RepID=A8ZXQ6_DESOH|nr:homoserine dehydrogenase [Desulfosudis oleivorans]ABW67014.1 homoserine dehydrogenase, NAD binding domain [Desulfosudis oleivorans Hxd3]
MQKQNGSDPAKIRIGIIGIGSMGKGLVYQAHITPGVRCVAVCDTDVKRCTAVLTWLHIPHSIATSRAVMEDVTRRGEVAVCEDGLWVAECADVDVVIEASSAILPAAEFALATLNSGKHLVLMNSEIDLLFGPLLADIARKNGVVCTSCDGDQYGVLKHQIDDLALWGLDLVMAGNIKGFLDRSANPTSIVPEADIRNLDYRMCTSYTDGTKLNIEMAIIANACGLITTTPGMHGPRAAHVQDVFNCFDFDALWKDRRPFVDYILGAEPGGGVFVIGHCDNPYQREMLAYYKMGPGPFYLFYRPYHLCHIEAMGTVLQAARRQTPFLVPDYGFQTQVYAYAKRDLKAGEVLDGIGGYCCYGLIENFKENHASPGLPIGLADNVALRRDVPEQGRISLDDVSYDPARLDFALFDRAFGLPANAAV